MKKTLSIRTEPKEGGADPRDNWGVKGKRLDRLHEMARDRRRNPSEAEKLLWKQLANQRLGGFKFKRQFIVGSSIVDFACPARWLVVEIDDADIDPSVEALSDRKLVEVGVRVLRFTSQQVLDDIEATCAAILEMLNTPFEKPKRRAPEAASFADDDASPYTSGY